MSLSLITLHEAAIEPVEPENTSDPNAPVVTPGGAVVASRTSSSDIWA